MEYAAGRSRRLSGSHAAYIVFVIAYMKTLVLCHGCVCAASLLIAMVSIAFFIFSSTGSQRYKGTHLQDNGCSCACILPRPIDEMVRLIKHRCYRVTDWKEIVEQKQYARMAEASLGSAKAGHRFVRQTNLKVLSAYQISGNLRAIKRRRKSFLDSRNMQLIVIV